MFYYHDTDFQEEGWLAGGRAGGKDVFLDCEEEVRACGDERSFFYLVFLEFYHGVFCLPCIPWVLLTFVSAWVS